MLFWYHLLKKGTLEGTLDLQPTSQIGDVVFEISGVGRGDGEVHRRVRATQEAAQECGEVPLVCGAWLGTPL
jgi:hypothetical protein